MMSEIPVMRWRQLLDDIMHPDEPAIIIFILHSSLQPAAHCSVYTRHCYQCTWDISIGSAMVHVHCVASLGLVMKSSQIQLTHILPSNF